jgi:hypothetical protein
MTAITRGRCQASGLRMSASFAALFRRHVVPSLTQQCQAQGLFVALGLIRFEEAFQAVMQAAIHRGALHLPPSILEDLEEWLCCAMTDAAASYDETISDPEWIAGRVACRCRDYCRAMGRI